MSARLSPLFVLALALPAHAEIIGVSGPGTISAVTGADRLDLSLNRTQSGLVIGYTEQEQVVVPANTICVDYLVTSSSIGVNYSGVADPGSCLSWLPAGTYDSHLLHLDPSVSTAYSISNARFTFDGEVAALLVSRPTLRFSDTTFGFAPNWLYPYLLTSRPTEAADSFVVSAEDAFTLNVLAVAPNTMDEIRVLTRANDTDGDGVIDRWDDCPVDYYDDLDGDGLCDSDDTCPLDADNDADGDDVCGDVDNCPLDTNADQADFDGDTEGDACDADDDDDGVDDGDDICEETELGAAADEDGCSLEQECPCDGWSNHGSYVSCVSHATTDLVWLGLMSHDERGDIVSDAAGSSCGR